MSWPLSQDYNEAIQSPASNFADPDLKRGEAVVNALGIPMPYSGNFADVYQVRCPDGSRWAVKCFTRQAEGLRERYQEISKHLRQAKLPFIVDFTYLEQGIRVAGKWYPVLKMQWVEGLTLNQFVRQYLDKPAMLEALLQIWGRMAKHLRSAEVSHCDLQHGNVLLVPGGSANSLALKLIDYDGMWIPALAGTKSGEVGHACYQHPQRLRDGTYSLDVDRFPVLLIATALRALKVRGKPLWDGYDNGDNLLFKEADLGAPLQSHLFLDLTKTGDALVSRMMDILVKALRGSLEMAPLLEEITPEAKAAATPSKIARPASATNLAPHSRPGSTAVQAVAPTVPVAPVVAAATDAAGALDFGGAATDANQPKRKRKAKSTSAPMKVWIAIAAGVLVVLSLLGGLAVWAMSGSPDQPKQTAAIPKPAESEAVVLLQIDQPAAEVAVDGRRITVDVRGNGNLVRVLVKPGEHTLSVSKEGFKPYVRDLTLGAGQALHLPVQLERIDKTDRPPPDVPTPVKYEGEAMIPLRWSSDFVRVRQDQMEELFPNDKWSGDAQLWCKPTKAGEFLDLQVPVPDDGKYKVIVYLTKARDYGVVQLSLDGKPLGRPIDCFEPEKVINTGPMELATMELKKGDAVLRIAVIGTNEKSVGLRYMFGLDCIVLEPASAALTRPPENRLTTNSIGMKLVRIEPGTFLMGSPNDEAGRVGDEGPQHKVEITRPFYLGVYPVTKGQFAAFVKDAGYQTEQEKAGGQKTWRNPDFNPPYDQMDDDPVVAVTRGDAVKFCEWLSKKENKTYELPTEAEWECACRAGTTTAYSFGDDPNALGDYAWFDGDSGGRTHPVGGKKPNPWGLYDMHGNVWQWCSDAGGKYDAASVKDPKYADNPEGGILRGGSWLRNPGNCRSAMRLHAASGFRGSDVGFRVMLRSSVGPTPPTPPLPPGQPNPSADPDWLKAVAALPPDGQVKAVADELKKRNPDFDGKVTPNVANGVVVGLTLSIDQVTDITPVQALVGLRTLNCNRGPGKGRLADLSPLKGMPLTSLNCAGTAVSDLSPLKGMPLTNLLCSGTQVSDLSPLKGMPLTSLNCAGTAVSDLSPLKDMPLMSLFCSGTAVSDLSPLKDTKLTFLDCTAAKVSDLSPLKDMKLTGLGCAGTAVSDLSPLKDMKLTFLNCSNTKVADLSPLKDMKLTFLLCDGTRVSDLSPLKGMPLTSLSLRSTRVSDLSPLRGMALTTLQCDFKPERDAEVLRSIPTLKMINGKPAADFWKDVNATQPEKKP